MKTFPGIFLLLAGLLYLGTADAQKQKSKPDTKTTQGEKPPPPPPPPGVEITPEPSIVPAIAPLDTVPPPADQLTHEIRRLLELTGALNLGVQLAKMMSQEQNPSLPQEFYTRFFQSFQSGKGKQMMENLVIKLYRKHFTLEEVTKLNKFYESPVGKKLIATTPLILKESQDQGTAIGQTLGMELFETMIKEGKIK